MNKLQLSIILYLIIVTLNSYSQDYKMSWQECVRTENYDTESRCIDVIRSNYLVGIYTNEPFEVNDNYHDNGDALYIMVDSIGNYIWSRCYGGFDTDQPEVIVYNKTNSIYLINETKSNDGDVTSPNIGGYDIWVVKIDLVGNIIWEKSYGSLGHDEPRDAILTQDGGVLIMSRIQDGGGQVTNYYGYYDNWIIKLDSLGNLEWETTIGSLGRDNGLKLIQTSNNTYLALCGVNDNGGMSECTMMNDPSFGLDLWLVELDLSGNILRQDCFGGSFNDIGYDIIETDAGYTIVSTTDSDDYDVSGNHGLTDVWLLNLSYERELQWQKCLGGSNYDDPVYLNIDNEGGYTIIGSTFSNDGDVLGNHGLSDVWFIKTDQEGNLYWQSTYGGQGMDWFSYSKCVVSKNDFTYVLVPVTYGNDGDVNCPNITGLRLTPWVFQIKDCIHYTPEKPPQPTGKESLCVNKDSITTYHTTHTDNSWYFEWELLPEESGIVSQDSNTTTIHWSPTFQGITTLKVRSKNDCGESAWSDSLVIQTYMCLGNNENEFDANFITIFPIPSDDVIFIDIDTSKANGLIQIIDISGKLIYEEKNFSRKSINIKEFKGGMYFLNYSTQDYFITKKIILNH